jgi:hypothetical protein
MKPHSIGRVLGIGLRVAGRIAGQRVAANAQTASGPAANVPARAATAQSRAAGQAAGSVARGVGGFLRPFRRVGGIIWLEVMGVFFFLPVLVFAPTLWRIRASYFHGPDHRTFVVTAVLLAVFLYLSVSSFWRARRK